MPPNQSFDLRYVCPGEYLLDQYPGIQPPLDSSKIDVDSDQLNSQDPQELENRNKVSQFHDDYYEASGRYLPFGNALGTTAQVSLLSIRTSPSCTRSGVCGHEQGALTCSEQLTSSE